MPLPLSFTTTDQPPSCDSSVTRTALFAGDKNSVQANAEELLTSELRPDRLLTELTQIRNLLEA